MLICGLLAACLATPAMAQSAGPAGALPNPEDIASRDSLTIGLGAAVTPDYEGSDDYRIIPAAAVRGKYHGIAFSTRGTYLFVDVVPGSGKFEFDAGPIAGVRLNHRTHIKDDIVELLPRRKTAIEVGGFAGVSFHGLTNPYDTLAFHLDVLHDVGGAHKSTTVSPNLEFSTPLSRTTYVGAQHRRGVRRQQICRLLFQHLAGRLARDRRLLPAFNADGGMKNWKAGLLLNQSLSGDLLHGLSLFGVGQYSRLVGDFRRSPIVSQRGSASQWLGALGLAYTW